MTLKLFTAGRLPVLLLLPLTFLASQATTRAQNDLIGDVSMQTWGKGPNHQVLAGGVNFKLYRQCDCTPCTEQRKPCRYCCITGKEAVASASPDDTGRFVFEDVPAGDYILVNEVNGKFAGLEKQVKVDNKKSTRLGNFQIDFTAPGEPPGNGKEVPRPKVMLREMEDKKANTDKDRLREPPAKEAKEPRERVKP